MVRPSRSLINKAAGLVGLFMLAGCFPPQADFSPGVSTLRISGFLNAPGIKPAQGTPLIVVYKFHRSFLSDSPQGRLLNPTAHVVHVARSGGFSINIPWDVVAADVFFIAPGRLTEVFQFKRTLGVGAITYRANLKPMTNWRDHFYTFLNPQLQHLIVENRYRLSPGDLRKLSQWLDFQNRRLTGQDAGPPVNNPVPSLEQDERGGEGEMRPAVPPAKP
ncbi:MAG: hypothetical protein V3S64_06580 [bacterium]